MALLNNLYIFVESEDVTRDVESSSHRVEQGFDITDHIQKMPIQLSLQGKIVDYETTGTGLIDDKHEIYGEVKTFAKASDILAKINQLKDSGSLISYVGRGIYNNMQIQSFSTSHPNTNWGGCDFSMTLKEVRIAKPAYTEKSNKNSGGTQQVSKGENEAVYHTVKFGDTVWDLVTKKYKSLVYIENGKTQKYLTVMEKCKWVMRQNPNAFSRKNDFGTLRVGKKILVGYRK